MVLAKVPIEYIYILGVLSFYLSIILFYHADISLLISVLDHLTLWKHDLALFKTNWLDIRADLRSRGKVTVLTFNMISNNFHLFWSLPAHCHVQ